MFLSGLKTRAGGQFWNIARPFEHIINALQSNAFENKPDWVGHLNSITLKNWKEN